MALVRKAGISSSDSRNGVALPELAHLRRSTLPPGRTPGAKCREPFGTFGRIPSGVIPIRAATHVAADRRSARAACAYAPCPRTRHCERSFRSARFLPVREEGPLPRAAARLLGRECRQSPSGTNERIAAH